jgi:uncharacterized membrane protein
MLPDPLHPAVVHFPVVLMLLLPLAITWAWWAARRGAAHRPWLLPVGLAAGLALSAWVAVETGEREQERVEDAVSEQRLEAHEEAAERFLGLSVALLAVTAAGLARGPLGRGARILATFGALAVAAAGAQVGHSGGLLVYRYGAASAYAQAGKGEGRGEAAGADEGGGAGAGENRDADGAPGESDE